MPSSKQPRLWTLPQQLPANVKAAIEALGRDDQAAVYACEEYLARTKQGRDDRIGAEYVSSTKKRLVGSEYGKCCQRLGIKYVDGTVMRHCRSMVHCTTIWGASPARVKTLLPLLSAVKTERGFLALLKKLP